MTYNGFDLLMHNVRWKKLEIEEQARARQLMRNGLARIDGSGADRKLVLTNLQVTS